MQAGLIIYKSWNVKITKTKKQTENLLQTSVETVLRNGTPISTDALVKIRGAEL